MKPVIGLFGFGRWGRLIFRDLLALGAEVRVVVPSEASRKAALDAGAASVHDCVGTVGNVDGFVVAVPSSLHAKILFDIAPLEKPVFVEKPMTTNPAECLRLVDLMGDRLFVMDKWRYHPGIERLAEIARSGEIGQILSLRSFRLGWDNPHQDVDAIWVLLPHDLSIALHILGRLPQPKMAMTLGANGSGNDLFAVLQDRPDEVSVIMEISANHPASRRAVTVIGTKGAAQLSDSYDDHIVLARGAPRRVIGKPELIPIGKDMPLLSELRAFLDYLNGGVSLVSSALEGAMIVERIAALRRLAGLE